MFKSSTVFDKLLDKATSISNLEPDWESILQICDSIRQNDVQPKHALGAIKKKINATNPNVQLMGFQVLESCVKNCGSIFHNEVATRQFMEDLHDLLKSSADSKVKNEILRLIQAWAHAFRNEPSYRAVQDQMRIMRTEGHQFPVLKESDAMFSADTAPKWCDGECCHRCRVQFTVVLRKHHCRNCGQVFCAKCSSRFSAIPRFGIEKEVRVCDTCFDKISKKIELKALSNESKASTTPKKTEQEIREEEELQLAIALSKSEAESREKEQDLYSQMQNKINNSSNISAPIISSSCSKHRKSSKSSKSSKSAKKSSKIENVSTENEDPELVRYLNREYWEQRSNTFGDYENSPSPSAPQPISTTSITKNNNVDILEEKNLIDKTLTSPNNELESFTGTLRSTIEIFVNRLNSNKLRGRPITNDTGVQSLFMNLTNLHSQLIMYTQQTNEARSNCERLQDKISQIRDARAALDALREEHREQMRRAAEEADRIRQQQMAQKLEIMRKKKQEYLQYQREIAIQRMQEQERGLMMRSEQFNFSPAAPNTPVATSQWNNATQTNSNFSPSSTIQPNYYLHNQTFPNPVASQQPQGMVVNGQYAQAPLPNNPNMVAAHHQPMTAPIGAPHLGHVGPTQSLPQHYVPQMSQVQPNIYLPPTSAGCYPSDQASATNQAPAVNQQQQYLPASATQTSQSTVPSTQEIKEELLIKFD